MSGDAQASARAAYLALGKEVKETLLDGDCPSDDLVVALVVHAIDGLQAKFAAAATSAAAAAPHETGTAAPAAETAALLACSQARAPLT